MKPPARRRQRDATIALINIVFLMLVFFLIAGTIAQPLDPDLTLVRTSGLNGREPPDALVIAADGTVSFRGEFIGITAYIQGLENLAEVRIVPDRDLPAKGLVKVAADLRAAGAERVMIVTQRALQ